MGKRVFLFEHSLMPAPAVVIGQLITNLRQPNLNYHNCDIDWPVTELPHTNFHQLITSDKAFKLRGELAKTLGGVSTESNNHQIDIHRETARQRTLDNPREYWEAIRTREATCKWINKTVKVYTEDIYLIVATYTVTDPSYVYSSSYVHTLGATGHLSADGALPRTELSGGAAGGEASVHSKSKGSQQRSFDAVGEMVYAAQYERLRTRRFGIFKQADSGKIELDKRPKWYNFKQRERGTSGDIDETLAINTPAETVIEADLDDDWDFVRAEDTEEWDKVIVGEEEVFFPNDDESDLENGSGEVSEDDE